MEEVEGEEGDEEEEEEEGYDDEEEEEEGYEEEVEEDDEEEEEEGYEEEEEEEEVVVEAKPPDIQSIFGMVSDLYSLASNASSLVQDMQNGDATSFIYHGVKAAGSGYSLGNAAAGGGKKQ